MLKATDTHVVRLHRVRNRIPLRQVGEVKLRLRDLDLAAFGENLLCLSVSAVLVRSEVFPADPLSVHANPKPAFDQGFVFKLEGAFQDLKGPVSLAEDIVGGL